MEETVSIFIFLFLSLLQSVTCNTPVQVNCSHRHMNISISNSNPDQDKVSVYFDKLKHFPGCQPDQKSKVLTQFVIPIDSSSFNSCGLTKLKNKLTGTTIFYHRLMIETESKVHLIGPQLKSIPQIESMVVKCVIPGDQPIRMKRQTLDSAIWELPDNFTETTEELIDFSGNVTARAPLPLLNIGVRQNGEFVDTAINVSPGTPLELVIFLDEVSASVYGLLTSFLRVTDNTSRKQQEIITLNGCAIDPYIFGNFETSDGGKSLNAKFRAFKFPDTNYVLFVGTVNVCINQCLPVNCGEGIFGNGRKRRSPQGQTSRSSSSSHNKLKNDPNKVYEAEITTFVRVGYDNDLEPLPLKDTHLNLDLDQDSLSSSSNQVSKSTKSQFSINSSSCTKSFSSLFLLLSSFSFFFLVINNFSRSN